LAALLHPTGVTATSVRNLTRFVLELDKDGILFSPTVGIPIRSSLSPFFSALYLSPLDKAFENKNGIFYIRYVDDIIILTETEKQYKKAKKKLFAILRELKLKLSPKKTRIGKLKNGFHFLGVDFQINLKEEENQTVKNVTKKEKEKQEVKKTNEVNEVNAIHSPQTIGLALPQSTQAKNHEAVVSVVLHARTVHRALDRVQVLRENTVNPGAT
jgi:vesicle coat complex subunit